MSCLKLKFSQRKVLCLTFLLWCTFGHSCVTSWNRKISNFPGVISSREFFFVFTIFFLWSTVWKKQGGTDWWSLPIYTLSYNALLSNLWVFEMKTFITQAIFCNVPSFLDTLVPNFQNRKNQLFSWGSKRSIYFLNLLFLQNTPLCKIFLKTLCLILKTGKYIILPGLPSKRNVIFAYLFPWCTIIWTPLCLIF
jgi:hypothetical protein